MAGSRSLRAKHHEDQYCANDTSCPSSGSFLSPTNARKLKSASGSQGVPSYAQPTISFSQREVNNDKKYETLKAGVSKSRPSSVTAMKSNVPGHSPISPKRPPSFSSLFDNVESPKNVKSGTPSKASSPDQRLAKSKNYGLFESNKESSDLPGPIFKKNTRSSSFGSPSLAKRVTDNDTISSAQTGNTQETDMKVLLDETAELISKFGIRSGEFPRTLTKKHLIEIAKGKSFIPLSDWYDLVNYHDLICTKFEEKIASDGKLVENVLEINRNTARDCARYRNQIQIYDLEIESLKATLNMINEKQDNQTQTLHTADENVPGDTDTALSRGTRAPLSPIPPAQTKSSHVVKSLITSPGYTADDDESQISEVLSDVPAGSLNSAATGVRRFHSYFASLVSSGVSSGPTASNSPTNYAALLARTPSVSNAPAPQVYSGADHAYHDIYKVMKEND